MSLVVGREKVSGGKGLRIRQLRHDYGFVFGRKLSHKHQYVSWCFIIVQNPWLVSPRFCAFLMNGFAQSAHNFLIDRTTLWQEFMMHHGIAIEENLHIWPNLALLDAFIRMIGLWFQCHSHTPMSRYQLWLFSTNLYRHWTSSTSPERCQCD